MAELNSSPSDSLLMGLKFWPGAGDGAYEKMEGGRRGRVSALERSWAQTSIRTAYCTPATGLLFSQGWAADDLFPPGASPRPGSGRENVERVWGDHAPSSPFPGGGLPSEECGKHCLAWVICALFAILKRPEHLADKMLFILSNSLTLNLVLIPIPTPLPFFFFLNRWGKDSPEQVVSGCGLCWGNRKQAGKGWFGKSPLWRKNLSANRCSITTGTWQRLLPFKKSWYI